MNYGMKTGAAWQSGPLPKQTGHHWAFICINMIWANLKTVIFLCALGFSNFWTNTRLHNGDDVWPQLRLRQDGELQDVSGDGGGGRSSLQTAETRLHQQVCLCCSQSLGCVFVCTFLCLRHVCLCMYVFYMPLHFKDRWGRRLYLSLNHGINWWYVWVKSFRVVLVCLSSLCVFTKIWWNFLYPRVHMNQAYLVCALWNKHCSFTVSEKPPLRSRERQCVLSGGCLRDKGTRTLASHRGRADLIGVIVLKKEC